jgi:hypothetical protein
LEHGFGQLRRLSPAANTAEVLANVNQKFRSVRHETADDKQ